MSRVDSNQIDAFVSPFWGVNGDESDNLVCTPSLIGERENTALYFVSLDLSTLDAGHIVLKRTANVRHEEVKA